MSSPTARSLIVLLRSLGSVTGVTLLTLGSYLAAVFLLGRNLPREDFGYITLWVYGLNLLGAASLFGFPNSLVRHASRERLVSSRWTRLFPRLLILSLVVAAPGSVLFARIYDASWRECLLLFAAVLTIGSSLLPVTVLQIFRRFAMAQWFYTLWRPFFLVGAILLVLLDLPREWVLFSVATGGLLQLGLAWRALRNAPRGADSIRMGELLPDALVFGGLFVTATLILRLDSFLLARLLDLDSLGLYAAISFVCLTGYGVVSLALSQVLGPRFASREPVPVGRLTLLVGLGGSLVGMLLAMTSSWSVPLLFGTRYQGDHGSVAAFLCAAGVLQVLYSIPSSRIGVLASRPLLRGYLPLSLTSLGVAAVLVTQMAPRWGLTGVAAATALTWLWRTSGAWIVSRYADRG